MSSETMTAHIALIDDQTKFNATTPGQVDITLDAPPPFGKGEGHTALDLFLISLADCSSTTMATLIRDRMRKAVTGLETTVTGTLRDERPKAFSDIQLHMVLTSPDLTDAEAQRALDSTEKQLCPVLSMLRGNVNVQSTFEIKRP